MKFRTTSQQEFTDMVINWRRHNLYGTEEQLIDWLFDTFDDFPWPSRDNSDLKDMARYLLEGAMDQ